MIRILLAGLFGGIVMFTWTFLAYTRLPIDQIGVSRLPDEAAILAVLQQKIGEKSGLYSFPYVWLEPDKQPKSSSEDQKIASRSPYGLVIYNAPGTYPSGWSRYLWVDFLVDLAEAIIAVILISQTRLTTFVERTRFFLFIGVAVAIATNLSYWNWYGFPLSYTLVYVVVQIVGFLLAGLATALVMRKTRFGVTSSRPFLQKLFWSTKNLATASMIPSNRLSSVQSAPTR